MGGEKPQEKPFQFSIQHSLLCWRVLCHGQRSLSKPAGELLETGKGLRGKENRLSLLLVARTTKVCDRVVSGCVCRHSHSLWLPLCDCTLSLLCELSVAGLTSESVERLATTRRRNALILADATFCVLPSSSGQSSVLSRGDRSKPRTVIPTDPRTAFLDAPTTQTHTHKTLWHRLFFVLTIPAAGLWK